MLLPRVLSAVVGIPLILAAIHSGGLVFFLLVLVVAILCLKETFDLFRVIGFQVRTIPGFTLGVIMFLLIALPAPSEPHVQSWEAQKPLLAMALTLSGVLLAFWELFHGKSRSMANAAVTLFSMIFVLWPLSHLVLLREIIPSGKAWCFFLFVGIWLTDIAAYAIGRLIGRRPLAPKVSPKKTVEGFFGGLLGALLASTLCWLALFRELGGRWDRLAVIGIITLGVVGQLSDLVESVLKREAKVKDSSELIPGHGGFLDRFDSFLLTTPLLYYYVILTSP
ncbi:MAG: phosphatidate cytidylyltransferase [Elusimicrobia bacterium]|nr:phosphatidate cytidylyltransferase [Elusimicrobiota bacterium]